MGRDRILQTLQSVCLLAGLTLLLVYLVARVHGEKSRSVELARFEEARRLLMAGRVVSSEAAGGSPGGLPRTSVDQSLWAEGRIAKYRESLSQNFSSALAVLRIPRIGLEVPVLKGIDEFTLNRAVAHIPGTALPGQPGNVAVAGHRDGFFRGLKDLELGDSLELETLDEKWEFTVDGLTIVTPDDVQVLDPTASPTLTLVTCYPFYFVGKAPERYIVRGSLIKTHSSHMLKPGAVKEGPS